CLTLHFLFYSRGFYPTEKTQQTHEFPYSFLLTHQLYILQLAPEFIVASYFGKVFYQSKHAENGDIVPKRYLAVASFYLADSEAAQAGTLGNQCLSVVATHSSKFDVLPQLHQNFLVFRKYYRATF